MMNQKFDGAPLLTIRLLTTKRLQTLSVDILATVSRKTS
jgi:hypothetical protein